MKGRSIDGPFINRLIKSLKPGWLRNSGSNAVRIVACGGRKELIERMPGELRSCLNAGANTTLMVWGDCDDDCADGNALKTKFWEAAQQNGVTEEQFSRVVFAFAKDRLENWIEFLNTGTTDESKEGARAKKDRLVADAAKKLAELCKKGADVQDMPKSLQWSCKNWRALADRMKS
ncbi:MAG: hypothetical protein JNG88_02680 [Phycisphaerales bacterium]|nr:hypothetical protein [Phycisphaerales bacterium]